MSLLFITQWIKKASHDGRHLDTQSQPALPGCCVSGQGENMPQKVNDIWRATMKYGCFFETHIHLHAHIPALTCTCTWSHMHLHTHVLAHTNTCIHMHLYTYAPAHASMCTCTYMLLHIHAPAHTWTCICVHLHLHIQVHIHICTHTEHSSSTWTSECIAIQLLTFLWP